MMRRLLRVLTAGALVMTALCGPSWAQESTSKTDRSPIPVLFRMSCWEVDDLTLAALSGKVKIQPEDIKGRLLQSQDVLGVSGQDCLIVLGRKNPIVYFDGRTAQFQIQYVDTGLELRSQWRPDSDLTVSLEVGRIADYTSSGPESRTAQAYPHVEVFTVEAAVPDVRMGDTILLGSAAGPSAAEHVRALDKAPKATNLVVTLKLEAP